MRAATIRLGVLGVAVVLAAASSATPVSVRGNAQIGWGVAGYVGHSSQQAAPNEPVTLLDGETAQPLARTTTDAMGKYEFLHLRPGRYVLSAGQAMLPFILGEEDLRLDLDLSSAGGQMNYAAAPAQGSEGGAASAGQGSGGGVAADPGPSDPGLVQALAGSYYGFSGSSVGTGGTERRLVLCPDGSYRSDSESGYSGGAGTGGAWGTASQQGGGGRWSARGTEQSGTIVLTSPGGGRQEVAYNQGDSRGCYYFGGSLLCYESAPRCP